MAFLVWGALMLLGGWRLLRTGRQETARQLVEDREASSAKRPSS
jgi:hypothetical protein